MAINDIGINGCTIQSLQDIINEILNGAPGYPGFYAIYGADINVNPNSPDGQMINIFAQGKEDTLQQWQKIYNSMDPDQATGTVLDQRCAYNGVVRQAGTYTQQSVTVVTGGAVTLPGSDLFGAAGAFTVQDGNGNKYGLLVTTVIPSASSTLLPFQAILLGPVTSAPNTITVPVTILPNVISVNNPTQPSSIGLSEETDVALRIRRQNSTALPSRGYFQGLVGALLDVTGVSHALVLENTTNTTDGNGIPGHSIWCILAPSTASATIQDAIANAIYVKRNAGCGMKGSITIEVPQTPGQDFPVQFDFATQQNLWFRATAVAITGTIDVGFLAAQVVAQFGNAYDIDQAADSSSIVAFLKTVAPNAAISAEGVSTDGVSYGPLVTPDAVNDQFIIAGSSYVTIST